MLKLKNEMVQPLDEVFGESKFLCTKEDAILVEGRIDGGEAERETGGVDSMQVRLTVKLPT
jgi:hypothetical protein